MSNQQIIEKIIVKHYKKYEHLLSTDDFKVLSEMKKDQQVKMTENLNLVYLLIKNKLNNPHHYVTRFRLTEDLEGFDNTVSINVDEIKDNEFVNSEEYSDYTVESFLKDPDTITEEMFSDALSELMENILNTSNENYTIKKSNEKCVSEMLAYSFDFYIKSSEIDDKLERKIHKLKYKAWESFKSKDDIKESIVFNKNDDIVINEMFFNYLKLNKLAFTFLLKDKDYDHNDGGYRKVKIAYNDIDEEFKLTSAFTYGNARDGEFKEHDLTLRNYKQINRYFSTLDRNMILSLRVQDENTERYGFFL